jgi:hypothetical protein
MMRVEGNATVHHVAMDLPGGRDAMVSLKIGHDESGDREEQRREFLLNTHPASFTEGLEREISRLTNQFAEITGYDKDGNPRFRVTGRDRELLEMKLANRQNGLRLAQRERALAEKLQAEHKAAQIKQQERIEAAAQKKAQELIEQDGIDRRAAQIAARLAGVK